MDHSARLRRLKDRLDGSCAVITDPMDIYYFTGRYMEGMERLVALVVSEEPLLVVPSLHDGETRDLGMERIVWHDGQDPFRMVAERVRGRPVLVQGGKIPYSHVVRLGLRPEGLVDDIVSEMRSVKDSEELEAMSMAVSIAERSFRDLLDHIQEGMTEADLARYLEDRFRANGADGPSFSTIVCFGENAANPPHHRPGGNRRLKRGGSA
ncbi:M24 family metallopeptidase [Thermogymnomonas acidicola]|uniref:M24 family metallopeptidase n=1 Tax=Thermogymnomonas acidicola TaxID=399579 RepID=UPI00149422E8|nr:M24 family metallopeptidase [Thermogymnomonas acidicola]